MKNLPDRVEDVVIAWSGITEPFSTQTPLATLWSKTGQAHTTPFQPQAVTKLISMLQDEFQHSKPDARDLSGVLPTDFKPPGAIDTVSSLVLAVMFAPTFAMSHALALGLAHPAGRAHFVNAVADEVVNRLAPANRPATKKTAIRKHTTTAKKRTAGKRGRSV